MRRSVAVAAKGAAVALLGIVAGKTLGQLGNLVGAAAAGAAEFGFYTLALSSSFLVANLSVLALDRGLLRHVSVYRSRGLQDREQASVLAAVSLSLVLSSAVTALFLLQADRLAALFAPDPRSVAYLFRAAALSIPLVHLLILANAVLDARQDMRYRVLSEDVGRNVSFLVLVLGGVVLGSVGAEHLIRAHVVSYAVGAAISLWLTRHYFLRRPASPPGPEIRALVGFSLPFVFLQVSQRVGHYVEIFLLGLLGSGAAVGIFAVAQTISAAIGLANSAIVRISSPMMAELSSGERWGEAEEVLRSATRWAVVWTAPGIMGVLLFGEDLLHLLGGDYALGAVALAILLVGQGVSSATGSVGVVLNMSGKAWYNVLNTTVLFGLRVILGLVLIPSLGLAGAALGRSAAVVLVSLILVLQVRRILGVWGFDRGTLRPAAVALLAGLLSWAVSFHLLPLQGLGRLMVGAALLGTTYLCGLLLFGLDARDRDVLRAALQRLRRLPTGPAVTS